MVGRGIWSTIHFFPLFFQLQAVIQEETDGPGLLIHGSVAGAIATILGFLKWDGLHGTRPAGSKWDSPFSKGEEILCS